MSHTHLRVTRIDPEELFLPLNSSFSVIEKSTVISGLSTIRLRVDGPPILKLRKSQSKKVSITTI